MIRLVDSGAGAEEIEAFIARGLEYDAMLRRTFDGVLNDALIVAMLRYSTARLAESIGSQSAAASITSMAATLGVSRKRKSQ